MAMMNTYLSLLAAVVGVFMMSLLTSTERKLTMSHVQNATLAGGTAMSATASMPVQPFGALMIGFIGSNHTVRVFGQ